MSQSLFSWTNFILLAVIVLAVIALLAWAILAIAHRVLQRRHRADRAGETAANLDDEKAQTRRAD